MNVKLKPIVFGGEWMDGYFIECVDGIPKIYSNKRNIHVLEPMSMLTNGKSNYPSVSFKMNGVTVRADLHRVIAENLLPFPRPKDITQEEWDATPNSVKEYVMLRSTVNHVDHNKYNWHLNNLEWTTAKGNARAYQNHRRNS